MLTDCFNGELGLRLGNGTHTCRSASGPNRDAAHMPLPGADWGPSSIVHGLPPLLIAIVAVLSWHQLVIVPMAVAPAHGVRLHRGQAIRLRMVIPQSGW